jgi:hypothetical protein
MENTANRPWMKTFLLVDDKKDLLAGLKAGLKTQEEGKAL